MEGDRERRLKIRAPALTAIGLLALAASSQAFAQFGGPLVRFKSPADGMHFAATNPVRMLADGLDPLGYQWNFGRMEADSIAFFVDNVEVARVKPTDGRINWFEAYATGLQPGPHALRVESVNWGGVVLVGPTITIVVDEFPTKAGGTISLTRDLMLSGSTDLTWNNVVVKGNGFKVRSTAGWSGRVQIADSFVTGLGDFGTPGIDVGTTRDVNVTNTVFDATGAVNVSVDGKAALNIVGNEFRANNKITFEPSNPEMSPVFYATGSTSGAKRFSANRVGAGIVEFSGMSDVLIGGNSDNDSNILIGPRAVLRLDRCTRMTVRGNYDHHDYNGGWSQGFNFAFYSSSSNLLVEHNVIRQGSWPVQDISGIFRYNLVVEIGHEWIRTALSGTKIHHNVFVHPGTYLGPNAAVDAGIWLYNNYSGVEIYNNTFDGGGAPSKMLAPALAVSQGSRAATFKNNVVTGLSPKAPLALVAHYDASETGSIVDYADYNAFYNPESDSPRYEAGAVVNGLGEHDVNANPQFTVGSEIPFAINEAEVWNRTLRVSQVLAHYRRLYEPAPGSPLIDAGAPGGTPGADIGAIEGSSGAPTDDDLFGKFGSPLDIRAPAAPSNLSAR
jgi:hypothetical protein